MEIEVETLKVFKRLSLFAFVQIPLHFLVDIIQLFI